MGAESLAAACLGSLFCQRLVGAAGSWWELGERQEGANRRWAPACIPGMLGGMWCLSGSQECWWVWGRVAGLRNDDADGCDSLPNEAEARLSRAFRTSKHRASLKAEWQDDEHAGDGLHRIMSASGLRDSSTHCH